MKCILSSILLMALTMLCTTASAEDFTSNSLIYRITSTDDKTVCVVGYDVNLPNIINIPNDIEISGTTYSVTEIGDHAFQECSGITTLNIPNSVMEIGESAFSYCSSLTTLNIPNSVMKIGVYAFAYCTSLTTLNIPNSVTEIGKKAFYYCSSLTTINIPNSVTNIDDETFKYCFLLTSVTIPNSVTNIGYGAFFNCPLTTLNIPNSVTKIGDQAFCGCSGITTLNLPNSVTNIGNGAFNGCSSLITLDIPNSVTNIGNDAFKGCSSLITLDIPNSVTNIGDWAFSNCSKLTTIKIANSVTEIGYHVFVGCNSLMKVTIPNVYYDFKEVSAELEEVTYLCLSPESIPFDCFKNYGTLHVVEGYKDVYENTLYWNLFNIVDDVPFTKVTEIKLNKTEFNCQKAKYVQLKAVVYPRDAIVQNVTWSSSDESVAQVEGDGNVVGMKTGTATITATANDGSGIYATAIVHVGNFTTATSITLDKTSYSMYEEEEIQLTATVLPTTTSDKTVVWKSNNESIATVKDGLIKAIAPGVAIVTATTNDGTDLVAKCQITVTLEEPIIELVDGEDYSNTKNQQLDKLTFTKTFAASTVGNWNAFYVPMSINVEEYTGKLDFAEIYAFCATVDTNGDGTVDANDENYLFVRPVKTGCIEANVPYLIRPHEAKTYVINSADNILYKSTEGKVEFSTTRDMFTVTGLNDAFTVTAGDNNYYVTTAGKLSYRATGSTTVKANRWIMHREAKEYGMNGSGAPEAKEYRIFTIGEDMDEETAIEAIKNSTEAINIDSGTIFTLDGKNVNATHDLPNGIYIKNGKKYLVK